MSAAITERLRLEVQERASNVEWQTRELAQYIAATAFGDAKKLIKQAAAIQHPLLAKQAQSRPRELHPVPEEITDDNVRRAAARNSPGSYERLMKGMAGPPA